MDLPGIVGTLRLAGVVVLALPLVLFGGERLVRGDPVGIAFLALGILMIALERLLTNPFDPADLAESAIDRLAGGSFDQEGRDAGPEE